MSDFGWALVALKASRCVQRSGWNGKGMWLKLIGADRYSVAAELHQVMFGKAFMATDQAYETLPWIGMKTADNKFVPWLASQTDTPETYER